MKIEYSFTTATRDALLKEGIDALSFKGEYPSGPPIAGDWLSWDWIGDDWSFIVVSRRFHWTDEKLPVAHVLLDLASRS